MSRDLQVFIDKGAVVSIPLDEFAQRLAKIKAFVFDWDGVFNAGVKSGDPGSPFAEPDSMGTNLLRLGYWLHNDRNLAVTAVISGATNADVEYFVRRESFDICMRGFHNKRVAWEAFLETYALAPHEVLFMFDDVLDLMIARECGLRICVRREASPAFTSYVMLNNLSDYLTANEGGQFAVRETCEFLLTMQNWYAAAIEVRVEHADSEYALYLAQRSGVQTRFLAPGDLT